MANDYTICKPLFLFSCRILFKVKVNIIIMDVFIYVALPVVFIIGNLVDPVDFMSILSNLKRNKYDN